MLVQTVFGFGRRRWLGHCFLYMSKQSFKVDRIGNPQTVLEKSSEMIWIGRFGNYDIPTQSSCIIIELKSTYLL